MNYTINDLVLMIESIQDDQKKDPRKGLLQLRELCLRAIDILDAEDPFAHEQQKLQSTVWVIERITATESSFDRWLLFVLRSKKFSCANMLRNYSMKEKSLIAA